MWTHFIYNVEIFVDDCPLESIEQRRKWEQYFERTNVFDSHTTCKWTLLSKATWIHELITMSMSKLWKCIVWNWFGVCEYNTSTVSYHLTLSLEPSSYMYGWSYEKHLPTAKWNWIDNLSLHWKHFCFFSASFIIVHTSRDLS